MRRAPDEKWMRLLLWFDVATFLFFAAWLLLHPQPGARYFAGIGIGALGIALWVTARLQLGRSFSVTAQARQLVITGLYAKFRHPIYLFAGLAAAGLLIAWGRVIPLVCFVLFYPVQYLRIRKEEAVLEQAFGEEYRRYKAGTWL